LAVKNHGVPESIIQDAFSSSKKFFALPLEAKMNVSKYHIFLIHGICYTVFLLKIENKTTPNYKGYSPLLSGNNDPNNNGDLQEGFEFGWEDLPTDAQGAKNGDVAKKEAGGHDGVMAGANIWPPELPEFRLASLRY
jgi:isopenicillin N synthase-like dioxygenase